MKTIGYKAMNKDMTCRNVQFEIGKTYTVDNDKPLELCSDSGFHFCQKLEDVFNYYDCDKCRLFEVETDSEILTEGDKSITKRITIKREIKPEELSNYDFENNIHIIYFKDLSDEELVKFKDNKNLGIRKFVVEKMKDLDLMFNTFKDDEDDSVRLAVVKKMEDLKLMYKTFKFDKSWIIRKAVISKMEKSDLMRNTLKLKMLKIIFKMTN